jgi:hypothetical protein
MKRNDFEWCREKEPSYRAPTRPVIPLSYGGALRTYFNGSQCAHSCIETWRGMRRCVECGVENP